MEQLILHLWGEFITQSEWVLRHKGRKAAVAFLHVVIYTLPFLLMTRHWQALAAIAGSHFLIDRFRAARFVVWFKNCFHPKQLWVGHPHHSEAWSHHGHSAPFRFCNSTGHNPSVPN